MDRALSICPARGHAVSLTRRCLPGRRDLRASGGAGCRARSMSSSVLALHFLGDPSTLTDLEALRPSPVADVSTALPGAGGPAGYRMPGHLPGIGDEYLRHLVKAPVVFGTQVNLQSAAVESDRPRLRVLCATADVARQCHSGLRCHPCPPIRCGRVRPLAEKDTCRACFRSSGVAF